MAANTVSQYLAMPKEATDTIIIAIAARTHRIAKIRFLVFIYSTPSGNV
jgi:hypothetical protein